MNDSKIALLLLRAQNASNGGKGIPALSNSQEAIADNVAGYPCKYACIKEALSLVQDSSFKCYIVRDYARKARCIITFETYVEGVKLWISFHCNCPFAFNCKRRPSHGNLLPSEEAAKIVYKYYVPNGTY